MGLFDTVTIEDGFDISFPGLDTDPTRIDWQTKTLDRPAMDVYKLTMNGRLFKEQAHYEKVPEEERPAYDEERGGFKKESMKALGMLNKVHDGWEDTNYHGIVEIHRTIDDEYVSFDLKFTDGELVDVTLNQ